MSLFENFLIAVGLSMDAFAVAVCKGLSMRKITLQKALIVGLYFGIFQSVMPLIGYFLGRQFAGLITAYDHWVTFALLALIGLNMIRESREKNEEEEKTDASLSPRSMLPLAIATSIDALAIGVSFAFLGMKDAAAIFPSVGVIGFVSFALSLVGLGLGIRFGCGIARRLKPDLLGGVILVLIGIKILIEHLIQHYG